MAHIYQGFQGDYYVIDGIKYDAHFPEEWARDHKDFEQESPYEEFLAMTGPEKCGNCAFYGTLRGVFVGYCGNCAREYNFERGRVFCFDFTQEEMWENLDYMKNVPIAQIGDEEIETEKETENYEPEIREIRERKQRGKKAQMKKNKKGKERRIRRALRKRQNNEEYIGMPKHESHEKELDVEFYIFLIYIFLMFLFLIPIFLLSR